MKVRKILVSQPTPTDPKSPYFELANAHGLTVEFCPFIKVEGIDAKTFRKQKIDILSYTAIVFTSKIAVDHFFRLCGELRVTIPDTMKYFCISESIAVYLQKYTVYRKRKIFHGVNRFPELVDVMKKHKDEKYLVPLSDVHKDEIPTLLDKMKLTYKIGTFYNTVNCDLKEVKIDDYDLIVLFSPQGITSLKENFPDFKQGNKLIGAFGPLTCNAVTEAGLRLDIKAPTPEAPSMTGAIENFIKANK
ncbi:MAG: uroporphyrinogen-III synthase [Bacteroidales bacterium]|nr:uroporphyrinogen-III synthase [Bacteroidales bacterium]MDD7725507.1 uroporphyrinogen-III synthase [Bacteroidales bacterium]